MNRNATAFLALCLAAGFVNAQQGGAMTSMLQAGASLSPTGQTAPKTDTRQPAAGLGGLTSGFTSLRVTKNLEALDDPQAGSVVVRSDSSQSQRVMLEKGQAHLKSGDIQSAAALFDIVKRRYPESIEARIGLGAIALVEGDMETAANRFREVLALAPKHPVAQPIMIGLRAAYSGEAGDGLVKLQELIQADSGNSLLHFVLGNLQARRGRWDEAAEAYRNALSLSPDNRSYAYNLAVAEDRRARPAAAAVYYRRALRETPGLPPLFDAALARARLETLSAPAPAGETAATPETKIPVR